MNRLSFYTRSLLEIAKNYYRRTVTKTYEGWLFLNETSGFRKKDIKTYIYLYKKIFPKETRLKKGSFTFFKKKENKEITDRSLSPNFVACIILINCANRMINNSKTTTSRSLKYNTKITRRTPSDNNIH